jgi:cupin 2 domain-containing protein
VTVVRGRLFSGSEAPASGERTEEIARLGDVLVEQILSGELPEPVDYDQSHDEWVLVLAGHAAVIVDDERLELDAGDLPAHVRHRLVQTQPGTSWLALHDAGAVRQRLAQPTQ